MTIADTGPIVPPPEGAQTSPISGEAASVNLHGNPAYEKAKLRGQTQVQSGHSLMSNLGDAIQTEWAPIWVHRMAFNRGVGFDADPGWNPSEDEIKYLIDGLPQEYLGVFDNAVSRSHAYSIRESTLQLVDRRKRLSESGMQGLAAQMGAAVFDPGAIGVGLVAGLVTGGIGAGAVAAGKATRIGAILKAAAAGAAAESAIEGVIAIDDPERGVRDVFIAGAAGGTFAGGFARLGLSGKQIAAAQRQALDAAERSQVFAMGAAAPNDPAFLEAWRRALTDNQQRRILGFKDLKQGENVSADEARTAWTEFHKKLDLEQMDMARKSMVDVARAVNPEYAEWLDGLSPEDVRKVFDGQATRGQSQVQEAADNDVTDTLRERASRPDGEPKPEGEVDIPIADQYGRNYRPGDLVDQELNDAMPSWDHLSDISPRATAVVGAIPVAGRRAVAVANRIPARVGTAGRVGSSDSPTMRLLANYIVEDVLPKGDGTIQQTALLSQLGRMKRSLQQRNNAAAGGGYRAWRKAHNMNAIEGARPSNWRAFDEAVKKAVDDGLHTRALPEGVDDATRAIHTTAGKYAKNLEDMLGVLKRHRVPGFEDVEPNAAYMPREWSPARVKQTYDANQKALEDAFARAFKAMRPDVSDEIATKVGRIIPKKIVDGNSYTDPRVISALRADNHIALDNLASLLNEEGVDGETIDFILDSMRVSDTETSNRAKKRTLFDMDTAIEGVDLGGKSATLNDLVEQSADKLMRNYTSFVAHASGTQRLLEDFSKARGRPFTDRYTSLEELRGDVIGELEAARASKRKIDGAMKDLDTLFGAVRGRGLEPDSTWADIARLMRSINFSLFGGTFGLAQIPELANIPAMTGWGLMLKSIPELNRVNRAIRNGEDIGIELNETMEAMGVGQADRILHGARETTDEITNRAIDPAGGALNKAQHVSGTINNGIAHATGLIFIDEQSRRLAAVSLSQKAWHYSRRFASTGKLPSKGWLARVGLDEDRARAMFAAMNKMEADGAITRRDGSLGIGKFTDFNVRKMYDVDTQAAGDFLNMVQRGADNIIYRADLGQLHPSQVRNPAIKIMLQFRSFATAAWERGVLQNVYHHDLVAAQSMLYTWMTASLVYMLRENAAASLSEDPEEYRRERLSNRAIATAGFRRAGPASFLPDIADTAAATFGFDPLFDYRNSGLSGNAAFQNWNIVQNNPTAAVAGRVGRLITDTTTLWREDETFTQGDFENASKLIPGHNIEGMRQILEKLGASLPEGEPDS